MMIIFYCVDMKCAYEFQRFEKVAWSYLKKGAKLVFEVRHKNFKSNFFSTMKSKIVSKMLIICG